MLGGFEHGIQAGGIEHGIGPLVEIIDPGGMDTVDDGVGNGAVPLAEETQQRLGPATSFASRLAFKHALLEDVVEDGVILDVER